MVAKVPSDGKGMVQEETASKDAAAVFAFK